MQSEAKREATEMDLVQRTQEHRKVLSELARAKIRVAQLEATVAAYEESGARIASTISLQKIHNAIATEMTAVSESVTDSNADSSRQDDLRDNYADMNENNYDSFNNPYVPTPKSWVRNYVSTDIDYAAGKTPELTTVPPSIAEVNRHKSGDMLSERGAKDLKATLAKLGRDTTLQVYFCSFMG